MSIRRTSVSPRRLITAAAAAAIAFGAFAATAQAATGAAGAARAGSSAPQAAPPPVSPVPADVLAASAAPGHPYTPAAASYGMGSTKNVAVTMADGTVLRADIYFPTDIKTGAAATGPFPVVMTQTPYGKSAAGSAGPGVGAAPYLVERGYLDVVADVRGTGDSQGQFGLFDPPQVTDGVALVKWAAALPHSSGKVGLYGASYLGINQILTAGAEAPGSPLKAIFPVVSANDIYRDTAFMGGILDVEFGSAYLGLTSGLNLANPIITGAMTPASLLNVLKVEFDHIIDEATFDLPFITNSLTGGDDAYDGAYWHARQPSAALPNIVRNGIAAYLVGGEYDLFQRGEPQNYVQLQNLAAGRPQFAPMQAGQSVTGKYQLIDGPFTHLTGSAVDIDALQLRWFDTWLKGIDTGMAQAPTPLHYYDLGTQKYTETKSFPFTDVTPTTYYLDPKRAGSGALSTNDGSLTTTRPTAATGADQIAWTPTGLPCANSLDQWATGPLRTAEQMGRLGPQQCIDDDRTSEVGPGVLTYTTPTFGSARVLGGPIAATIYATATTAQTEWVANIEDVGPDGRAQPLTEGALLGSLRAVDPAQSWKAPDGNYLLPFHPYTKASEAPVTPGARTRYDIEIFPTRATIAAGHRIRLTLSTSDTPHLLPSTPNLLTLAGGVYQVQHTAGGPSSVELPLAAVHAAPASTPAGTQARGDTAAKANAASGVRGGALAFTGLSTVLPALALAFAGSGLALRRRRRPRRD